MLNRYEQKDLRSMTGTPGLFAGTPKDGAGEQDLLAGALRAVRLTGSVFLNARFTAPFGVTSPKDHDERTPLGHLRHITIFHLVAAGSCVMEMANGERRTICAGDVLMMPFADTHRFWDGDVVDMPLGPDLFRAGPIDGLWTIDHGGGGRETRMVCGFIESSEFLFAPVFRTLPPLMIERAAEDRVSALITSTVREILVLAEAAVPGTELLLGRLMELLFIEMVRRYAARLPADSNGWLAGLNEPIVGRALRIVHADPARRWTVEELARATGTSRTVLNERFNAVLGQAPMEYVAGWRMQLAIGRLRNSTDSLAAISADVGYDSEAAFNRAFKRLTGVPPGRWRSDGRATAA
jgi:AraC-like DNA-binding protein